ncbi:MAG: hypothetical protein QOE90_907 [Thermoplasmata archaeon]|jgi:ABC-type transport system involved in multi-copper enzyme maturation permease subunit|nr:hypothetical protein [Thermoplasmata archaeon]
MLRAFRAEWYKLWRRGMVLGGLGTMVGIALLVVILVFANAQATPPPASANPNERPLPTFAALAAQNGMVLPFGFAGGLLGLIALVLFAQSLGSEYRDGTLKVLLSREPRRLRLLAGKLAALACFVLVGVTLAFLLQSIAAFLMAGVRGISTASWTTWDAMQVEGGVLWRTCAATLAHGLLGAALAILLRAAAPAIGVGIGYTLLGEPLILLVWRDGRKWLPEQVFSAFAAGGNAALSFGAASLLATIYAAALLAAQGGVFWRRDVTT